MADDGAKSLKRKPVFQTVASDRERNPDRFFVFWSYGQSDDMLKVGRDPLVARIQPSMW
jgi:hypothetical protein